MGISNPKLKSMGMAFGLSALAAIGTMFLPVAMLEGLTGATGLSELVPATAAPLGDTARALIAFGAGALTLAVLAILMLRNERVIGDAPFVSSMENLGAGVTPANATTFMDRLKERMFNFKMPQMPWTKDSDDDILDLADLPKLRALDAHPDAPARRPFSAGSDLAFEVAPAPQATASDMRFWPESADAVAASVVDTAPVAATPVAEPAVEWPVFAETDSAVVTPVVEVIDPIPSESAAPVEAIVAVDAQPSLAELVTQLEQSVILRQQQLRALEIVAAQIKSETAVAANQPAATIEPVFETVIEPVAVVRTERPPLEAVPASDRQMADEDMDAALNAALETLQRMNVQGR
jgi:hypothetical protein